MGPTGEHAVVVAVGASRCGLMSRDVLEVLAAVAITPLPGAGPLIEGVIDVRGTLAPVIGLRRRLGLADRDLRPDDRLVLVDRRGRALALRVDAALELVEVPADALDPLAAADAPHLAGVATLPNGLLLICDLDAFLSQEEEAALAAALAGDGSPA